MPASLSPPPPSEGITKFTNGRILRGNQLIEGDLWVSSRSGKIVQSQDAFYSRQVGPDQIIDLKGRILSPGLIDCQLNGAFGFNFSILPAQNDMISYKKELDRVNRSLVRTGLTSYLPTLTSQLSSLYKRTLPFLGPSGASRQADNGCESLGAHCEGPFLSPTKNGIHDTGVFQTASQGFSDFENCYGADNLQRSYDGRPAAVKMITAAPEVEGVQSAIRPISERDIIFSIGHSEATYEEACAATDAGANMVTHLFNAMRPLHHRNPGVFGLLGQADTLRRPYFGVIADGIHLHPTSVKIAANAHPEGFILVTDAMHLVGLADGVYEWSSTGGARLEKRGAVLTLEGQPDKIAGSSVTLLECVANFLNWTGAGLPVALAAVTSTPAKMLGLEGQKGCLEPGADADLIVLEEVRGADGRLELVVEQTWKFGVKVFDRKVEGF